MTFSYALPIATDVHRVRLHIADTQATPHVFEDEELSEFLGLDGDVLLASARALRVMAADASRLAVALTVPGLSLQTGSAADKLLSMADKFESMASQRVFATSADWYPSTDSYYDAVLGTHDVDFDRS
jgi:hypothetical protein